MGGETGFGGNHTRKTLGMTRWPSAGGQERRCLSRGCAMSQWALGLDMAWGSPETSGAFIKMAVDADVTKFPTLKADLVVSRVVSGKGHIMVAASPPDFSTGDGGFLFLSERGR